MASFLTHPSSGDMLTLKSILLFMPAAFLVLLGCQAPAGHHRKPGAVRAYHSCAVVCSALSALRWLLIPLRKNTTILSVAHKTQSCLAPTLPKPFSVFYLLLLQLPRSPSLSFCLACSCLRAFALPLPPVILLPHILTWLTGPLPPGLCLKVTSSERPSWTILQNISLPCPLQHPLPGPPQPARVGLLFHSIVITSSFLFRMYCVSPPLKCQSHGSKDHTW